jgi:hypothetical protein
MGFLSFLRGNNDVPKRAYVKDWLETLEFPDPEPPPPLPEPQPIPVWQLKPPTPLPAMRRFENVAISPWQDPYATTFRMPPIVYPPYTASSPYDASKGYTRVLLPRQYQSSDEDEGGYEGTSSQAGMICHESLTLFTD